MTFDRDAAWLRRFTADAQGQFAGFALRLREALPEHVTLHEKRGLFGPPRITGLDVTLGENRYRLELARGHLTASVALIVRGITLNTREITPGEWFARLQDETSRQSAQAEALASSLAAFGAG